MYIIIVGCSEIGSRLAKSFSSGKDNVVVIDKSRRALKNLGPGFNGRAVNANGGDLGVLKEAGIESADVLVVLTSNENLNLVIAQAAKKIYNVKKAVVQIQSPQKEEVFKKKGIIMVNRTNLFLDEFKQCILS